MASVDIRRLLDNLERLITSDDIMHIRQMIAKVMTLHFKGFDVSETLPKIIMLLPKHDLVVKKSLHYILTTYSSSNAQTVLLAISTLHMECSNSNPMVRGLAIRTICSFNHECFFEFGITSVKNGLKDSSAYVRRAAVLGSGQLNQKSIGICQEHGIVDQLYRSIRDADPVVMVNAVVVLEEILKSEGGIVINKNIAQFLLGKVNEMTPWGLIYVFQILKKYQPKSEDEMFDILNILDPFLTHNNMSLAVSCFELFLNFVKDFTSLRKEVVKRCFDGFVNSTRSGNPEVVFCILEIFENYIEEAKDIIIPHSKLFICKQKEPSYLKAKKINFMQYILSGENVLEILDEMCIHSTDSDDEVSGTSMYIISTIYQNYPTAADKCRTIFKQLLLSNVSHVVSNCLHVLQKIDLSKLENCADFITIFCQSLDFISEEKGKCALLILLGNYGEHYSDTPYVVEDFIENNELLSSEVKSHLLHCCIKLFFHYPAVCQQLLGKVFDLCFNESDECLRSMAGYYYSLLQTNVEDAKHVIMNCTKVIDSNNKV